MKNIVIASTKKSAGKTSIIVGLEKALGKKIGYMKPFGDRLLYKKKRLWDHDASVITDIFRLTENPEDITIGFEHAKLRYMFDAEGVKEKLREISQRTGKDKDILFVEGGMNLDYGASVHLDAIEVAKNLSAELIVVISGSDGEIADDITFLKDYVNFGQVSLKGVIINKVADLEDFKSSYLESIKKLGIPVLGTVPYTAELSNMTVGYLADNLFGKVIAGEGGLNKVIQSIFVGAMSADMAEANQSLKGSGVLIITSGDRSDIIAIALENNAVGIVLTNNLLPPTHLISKASEKNIPMLMVSGDTYQVAKQVDNIEPLLTKDDAKTASVLERLVRAHVAIKEIA